MATFTNNLQITRPAPVRVGRMSPHRRLLSGSTSGRRSPRQAMVTDADETRPTSLLDEARRRMKSNMQAHVALLRLCPEGDDHASAEARLTEMENRLQSMAALHRAQCRAGSFDQIDLAVFLRQAAMLRTTPARSPLAGGWSLDPSEPSLVWSRDEDDTTPSGPGHRMDLEGALARAPEKWKDLARRAIYACVIAVPPAMFTWRSPLVGPSGRSRLARGGEVRIRIRPAEDGVVVEITLSDRGPGLPAVFEVRDQRALGAELVSILARLVKGSMDDGSGSGAAFEVAFVPSHETVLSSHVGP